MTITCKTADGEEHTYRTRFVKVDDGPKGGPTLLEFTPSPTRQLLRLEVVEFSIKRDE